MSERFNNLDQMVQHYTGMQSGLDRKALLPRIETEVVQPEGQGPRHVVTGVTAPQALYDLARAYFAPAYAASGAYSSPEQAVDDAVNTALNVEIGGGLGSHVAGPVDKGIVGMAVKPRGGNWLPHELDAATKNLLSTDDPTLGTARQRAEFYKGQLAALSPEDEDQRQGLELLRSMAEGTASVDDWVRQKLRRYIQNDLATSGDPMRKAIKEGKVKFDQEATQTTRERALVNRTRVGMSPEEELGTPAAHYEAIADASVNALTPPRSGEMIKRYPWLEKLDPESFVYHPSNVAIGNNLGFEHIVDELRVATAPNSPLPPELRIKPEKLKNMRIEQAAEHVDKINEWRATEALRANLKKANNPATHTMKELPKQGQKWVELKPVEGNPEALEEAMQYEGGVMKHCVGGYCGDVERGDTRIVSLRDVETGEPFVTIELGHPNVDMNPMEIPDLLPDDVYDGIMADARRGAIMSDLAPGTDEFEDFRFDWLIEEGRAWLEANMNPDEWVVKQVKGKSNSNPDKYHKQVQDIIREQGWSIEKDFQNTGFAVDTKDQLSVLQALKDYGVAGADQFDKAVKLSPEAPRFMTGDEFVKFMLKAAPPAEKFAEGGSVGEKIARFSRDAQFKLARMIGLGDEVGFATEVPEQYFPADEQHNLRGDAMRHILLQAQLMKKYGEMPAEVVGWLHENMTGPQGEEEKAMDLANDAIGRRIGREAKDADEMIRMALEAIESGEAAVLSPEELERSFAEGGPVHYDPARIELLTNQFIARHNG